MKFYRFRDLKDAGIVRDRATLRRWIRDHGFPEPMIMGPNSLAWEVAAVEAWVGSRPRGAAPQPSRRTLGRRLDPLVAESGRATVQAATEARRPRRSSTRDSGKVVEALAE